MQFKQIDIEKDQKDIVKFRTDSFRVSFGDDSNFDETEYLAWLKEKIKAFPEGFVLVEKDGKHIGQLELSIREYEGKKIGYVHLYYLIPHMRGKEKGKALHHYARQFFEGHHVDEFHLRVAPSNASALAFYRKLGMKEAGLEVGGKVIRMIGYL